MFILKNYTEYIEKKILEIDLPEKPNNLYEPIRYFLNLGGKRIRPILTLLAAELFGIKKGNVLYQALAIEIFHNFTLIHDDIMDEAMLRRNKETIHEKWDKNIGILTGDVMLIQAYQLLSKNISPNTLKDVLLLFNKTAIEVCEGQQSDMNFEHQENVSIAEYIQMIRKKTSVLLGCALQLGAIIASASTEDKDYIYEFGINIGIAFQIQDDILDLYGDPEKFGKKIGGDIIANKKTILYLTALNKADKEELKMLKTLKNEKNIELKIKQTRELFNSLKIKEDCENLMKSHYEKAKKALSQITVLEENKEALIALSKYLMNRDV
ncbi:MAG: isoprenyl synthetase [Crocinitomicaceae bacterium]|nr:isoprenyl synthetase [Crocinitomicaceae bacterium]|tara:strand:- start:6296 stop:7267 length:972 start_codon:yes stop_codon:yes gene_type:complete